MREFRDKEFEGGFSYGRPTVSAWIAAVAVALAVFMLGGFIKTYRQLESLREESRREIQELRMIVDSLRSPPELSRSPARIAPLPPARRQASAPASRAMAGFPPETAAPLSGPAPGSLLAGMENERPRLTYSIGRTSDAAGAAKPQCQVIAVHTLQKRIIVEGGRNLGLDEGTRLELSRRGRWIGDLRVVDVFDTMSSCEVLHATLPPDPGDIVRMPQ